jgi:hypothetical protein
VQYRPTAEEILQAVSKSLEEVVLPKTTADAQHTVRVAANLLRILQRELQLSADANAHEAQVLSALLGTDGSLESLRAEFVQREDVEGNDDLDPVVLESLATIVRRDLAIAKPGYDSWTGG